MGGKQGKMENEQMSHFLENLINFGALSEFSVSYLLLDTSYPSFISLATIIQIYILILMRSVFFWNSLSSFLIIFQLFFVYPLSLYIKQQRMQGSRIIDSYIQKINRLTSHNISLEEELMTTKIRLRTAQDTCLKYQILLKELEKENEAKTTLEISDKSKINQVIEQKIAKRDKYWSQKVTQLESQIQKHYETKINELKEQLTEARKQTERSGKSEKPSRSDDIDLLNFKCKKLQRDKQNLQQTIINLKLSFEKSHEEEISKAKKILEIQNRQKQDNERKIYRQKIDDLQKQITDLKQELDDANMRANPQRENEITKLKEQVEKLKESNSKEIKDITQYFAGKNKQLEFELSERIRKEQVYLKEEKELRKNLKKLEDYQFQSVKKHDEEILEVTEKMSKLRDQEISLLKAQLYTHQEAINRERTKWDNLIEDKDKELQRIIKKAEEDEIRYKEEKGELKAKVSELKHKLREYEGNRQASQTLQLTQSLRELEVKEADFANYENTVTFLGRGTKIALMRIQQKNIQINRLLAELNSLRKQNETDLKKAKDKMKKERNNLLERIQKLQYEVRMYCDKNRLQDKQARSKYKEYEKQIVIIMAENKHLKEMIDEMQKDYERVLANKNVAQSDYRDEREKVFTSKTDLTLVKKQKWLELERQKTELAASFREKEEQLNIKHEIEREKLRNERDELRSETEKLKQILEELRKEHPSRVFSAKDKENMMVEYEKKVATLNLEVQHTKHIYQALRNVRGTDANPLQPSTDRNFSKISEQVSESDGRELNLEPSPRTDEKAFEKNNMAFSFDPRSHY